MTTNTSGLSPYIDAGTGAVDGPPPSVTVESPPEHLAEPTGASPNPPASVTSYADDTYRPKAGATEAKAVEPAGVETKVVEPGDVENKTAAKRPAGKRGS